MSLRSRNVFLAFLGTFSVALAYLYWDTVALVGHERISRGELEKRAALVAKLGKSKERGEVEASYLRAQRMARLFERFRNDPYSALEHIAARHGQTNLHFWQWLSEHLEDEAEIYRFFLVPEFVEEGLFEVYLSDPEAHLSTKNGALRAFEALKNLKSKDEFVKTAHGLGMQAGEVRESTLVEMNWVPARVPAAWRGLNPNLLKEIRREGGRVVDCATTWCVLVPGRKGEFLTAFAPKRSFSEWLSAELERIPFRLL